MMQLYPLNLQLITLAPATVTLNQSFDRKESFRGSNFLLQLIASKLKVIIYSNNNNLRKNAWVKPIKCLAGYAGWVFVRKKIFLKADFLSSLMFL